MRHKFNLSDIEYCANPFEAFGRLRKQGPIVRGRILPFPFPGKPWLVTTYAAVDEVLKNDKLFLRDPCHAGRIFVILKALFGILMPRMFKPLIQNMLNMDGADHRRLRSLVDQAFQWQSITRLRPRIEEFVDRQLDHVAELAAQN